MISDRYNVSIWHYLGATAAPVVLLFLSVIGLILYLNTQLKLTEREICGAEAIRMLHEAILDLQEIRGLSEIASQGSEVELGRVKTLQELFTTKLSSSEWNTHQTEFKISSEISRLQREAENLFLLPLDGDVGDARFAKYTQIIADLSRASREVAERSNLVLDPELDTNYIMNLGINQLPQLIEFVGQMRGKGGGLIAAGSADEEDKILFRELLATVKAEITIIDRTLNALSEAAPQIIENVDPLMQLANQELNRYMENSKIIVGNETGSIEVEAYFDNGTKIIDLYHRAIGKMDHILLERLHQRRDYQRSLQFYTLAGSSAAALLIIYFITAFYKANRSAFQMIEQLCITDSLTSLYNRRHLHEVFPKEILRSRREGKSLSFGLLDVDHFKRYNDLYGHPAGDVILRTIADNLRESLRRAGDYVFRIGGEEYCFIVTGVSQEEIKNVLSQIVTSIAKRNIEHRGNEALPVVTVSIGLAHLEQIGDIRMDEIIACADDALYDAKDKGRNCWQLRVIRSQDRAGQVLGDQRMPEK